MRELFRWSIFSEKPAALPFPDPAEMDVFALRESLIEQYSAFARSFTEIRANDIRDQVEQEYDKGRFWPDPLIQINPKFKLGRSVAELVSDGTLHAGVAKTFGISLYNHQEKAIGLARAGKSYVVTTGTGSGKSLCFFIPIVDAILRAQEIDPKPRTGAIIIYPMNALANSQVEELEKYLGKKGSVTFARYTGQESAEEREDIRKNPPDILLTNFMMLELLMTRQAELDQAVIRNCEGLRFLVLDELHTYRGRQGADVAMLVRRVRERLGGDALQRIRQLLAAAPPRLIEQVDALVQEVSTTEAVSEVKRRIGQDLYRKALLAYWNGACALTGLAVPELLRASHAKPWKDASDSERLDVHNGLLLAVQYDALFDKGFISFDESGAMLVSPLLPAAAATLLGVDGPTRRLRWLIPQHLPYLQWHRLKVFRAQ